MLTFRFSGADGILEEKEILTAGMVRKKVKLVFSSDWDNMTKTVVFTAGSVTRAVVGVSDVAEIPAEVLATPLEDLYVGVYGVSMDGTVTPTIRVKGPEILPGTEPAHDEGTNPDLAVWAQLLGMIGNLQGLDTEAKDNLVAAINEIVQSGGSGYVLPIAGKNLGGVKNGGNVVINEDGTMTAPGAGQNPAGGGLSATATALLINILRNAMYTADQSVNITALESALLSGGSGEPDTPADPDEPVVTTYTIVSALLHATSNNASASVESGASYTATITAEDGYTLDGATVSVTMGGVDITETAYANGVITIASVTGNVMITVNAVSIATVETLYELTEPTAFAGTNAIDTGVALLATDMDWSICIKLRVNTAGADTRAFDIAVDATGNNRFALYLSIAGASEVQWFPSGYKKIATDGWVMQKVGNELYCVLTHTANSNEITAGTHFYNAITNAWRDAENATVSGTYVSNTNNLKLGTAGITVDSFKILNRVLSADEIAAYLEVA